MSPFCVNIRSIKAKLQAMLKYVEIRFCGVFVVGKRCSSYFVSVLRDWGGRPNSGSCLVQKILAWGRVLCYLLKFKTFEPSRCGAVFRALVCSVWSGDPMYFWVCVRLSDENELKILSLAEIFRASFRYSFSSNFNTMRSYAVTQHP